MRLRKQALGTRNLVGARVEIARKKLRYETKGTASATAGQWGGHECLRPIKTGGTDPFCYGF